MASYRRRWTRNATRSWSGFAVNQSRTWQDPTMLRGLVEDFAQRATEARNHLAEIKDGVRGSERLRRRRVPVQRDDLFIRVDHQHHRRAGLEVLVHLCANLRRSIVGREHLDREIGCKGQEPARIG